MDYKANLVYAGNSMVNVVGRGGEGGEGGGGGRSYKDLDNRHSGIHYFY